MTEFQTIILLVIAVGTFSVWLNIYLAYHINRLERENEELIKNRKNMLKNLENM